MTGAKRAFEGDPRTAAPGLSEVTRPDQRQARDLRRGKSGTDRRVDSVPGSAAAQHPAGRSTRRPRWSVCWRSVRWPYRTAGATGVGIGQMSWSGMDRCPQPRVRAARVRWRWAGRRSGAARRRRSGGDQARRPPRGRDRRRSMSDGAEASGARSVRAARSRRVSATATAERGAMRCVDCGHEAPLGRRGGWHRRPQTRIVAEAYPRARAQPHPPDGPCPGWDPASARA